MLERNVWALIHNRTRAYTSERWMRCENAVAFGVPDINACVKGHEFWLEIKCPFVHVRNSTPIFGGSHKLTPIQKSWFRNQANAGGKVFLLVCNEKFTFLLDGTSLPPDLDKLTVYDLIGHSCCVFYSQLEISDVWGELKANLISFLEGKKND